ncbi:hypothetical protein C4561_04165 [candidate division WWE3 bacterium]|jgi:capsular polysaccharide biosynthesis protein|uniref:Polysaccharide chain length determinant N-terminal domain-containing protein n=1 Tax=candidate division WWE3 bacterium TaxID=2053526 RepID=A0A3A4ZCG2_UNCKA|nr:MAG: hypothetical protein C4561_04165 [candidate division WWE3 bacterium]
MELKDLIKKLKKEIRSLVMFVLVGTGLGLVLYNIPAKYISTGSFYIQRTTENSSNYFTYEGYYGQQTALSYTNTVAALLESVDLRTLALAKLNVPVNEVTLRKYQRFISVNKDGPQLISLTVKGNTHEESKGLWESLSSSLIDTTVDINKSGDANLSISKITDEPVVKKEYKSIWINLSAGFGLGLIAGILFISFKEYFKK